MVLFYRCVVDVDSSYELFRSTADAGLPEDILLAIPQDGLHKRAVCCHSACFESAIDMSILNAVGFEGLGNDECL